MNYLQIIFIIHKCYCDFNLPHINYNTIITKTKNGVELTYVIEYNNLLYVRLGNKNGTAHAISYRNVQYMPISVVFCTYEYNK